ncbi:MAG: glycine cleavage system protein GcvH [Candidatus Sericytochromatia bacterium]|nr:glycine cleavage system protein GcvH [Candidatus Sericytochromatia bacterium]
MTLPAQIAFVSSHEYLVPDAEGATIGISKYAAEQLGDVVFVELPPVGKQLARGESFGVVESVKAVSDLYAPMAGEVVAVNEALNQEPGLVSEDPYGQGWIIRMKGTRPEAGDGLMDAAAYEAYLGGL